MARTSVATEESAASYRASAAEPSLVTSTSGLRLRPLSATVGSVGPYRELLPLEDPLFFRASAAPVLPSMATNIRAHSYRSSATTVPVLPRILRVRPKLRNASGYVISERDILAAIREGKNEFIELMFSHNDMPIEAKNSDVLWGSLSLLATNRLISFLEFQIKNKQKEIITDYKRYLTSVSIIDTNALNRRLAETTSAKEPIYAHVTEDLFGTYTNQLWDFLKTGDQINCNDAIYSLDEDFKNPHLTEKIAEAILAFIEHCITLFKFNLSEEAPITPEVLEEYIEALNSDAERAKSSYEEFDGEFVNVYERIARGEAVLEENRAKIALLAASFTTQAPSTFARELAGFRISPEQEDFQHQLAQIFLASSRIPLQYSLFLAVMERSPEMVDLLLAECQRTNKRPIVPEIKDKAGNTILHVLGTQAELADSHANFERVLRILTAVLRDVKRTESIGNTVIQALLLNNYASEPAIKLLLQANRFKVFLLLRTYITQQLINHAMSERASPLQHKIFQHLSDYEKKLKALEEKPSLKTTLEEKRAAFVDTTSYPDELPNCIIQRRKALESLWVALWIANITETDTVLIDQIRRCGEMSEGYSEPTVTLYSSNALTAPLLGILREYFSGVGLRAPSRVSMQNISAAGTLATLGSASSGSQAYSSLPQRPRNEVLAAPVAVTSPTRLTMRNIRLSIELEKMFKVTPIQEYPVNLAPLTELRLNVRQNKLVGLSLAIYNLILDSYKNSTSRYSSFFFSSWTSCNAHNWDLQRKHMSRMIAALRLIADEPAASYVAQSAVVDQCLLSGLQAMANALDWIRPASSLFVRYSLPRERLLEAVTEDEAVILSPEIAADRISAELAEVKATAAEYKAANDARIARLEAALMAGTTPPSNAAVLGAQGLFPSANAGAASAATPSAAMRPS